MLAIAAIGLAISAYLTVTKLAGGSPICGPLQGCETVDASAYSTILGIPTAAYGIAYSLTLIVATAAWWRSGDRRILLAAYALSLIGVVMEGFFVYLQVAVIHAVCVWCAGYGLTVARRLRGQHHRPAAALAGLTRNGRPWPGMTTSAAASTRARPTSNAAWSHASGSMRGVRSPRHHRWVRA